MDSRLLCAALLVGVTCAGCDHPDNPTFKYLCDDFRRPTVTYFVASEPSRIRLVDGEVTFELPHVTAASGARFSDGKVTWWEHGGRAVLSTDSASTECVELPG